MTSSEQALRTIAKGAGIVFLGVMLSKVFSYFFRIVVARLGSDQYGLFSIGIAVFGVLGGITMLGTEMGLVRFVSLFKEQNRLDRVSSVIRHALKFTIPFSLIISFIVFLFADSIATVFFHDTRLIVIIQMMALFAPVNTARKVFLNSLIGLKRVDLETVAKAIAENFLKLLLSGILVYLGYGALGALFGYVLAIIGSTVLAWYFLEKKVFSFIKNIPDRSYSSRELLAYSLPLSLSILVYLVILWLDTIMLGYFKDASAVGIYNAALPTAQLLMVFPNALMGMFLPVLSGFADIHDVNFRSVYTTVTKWILMVDGVVCLSMIFFAKDILERIFGAEYIVGASALMVLSLGFFLHFVMIPSTNVLFALHKTKLVFVNNLIAALMNFFLNLLLIPEYGILGAGIATACSLTLMGLLMLIEAAYFTSVIPINRKLVNVLVALLLSAVGMWYASKLFILSNVWMLGIVVWVSILFYVGLLFVTRSFDEGDRLIMKSILTKLRMKKN